MVADRRGHAAHAGWIRRHDRQWPWITRGVPNRLPGTGLEPEVVGSRRGEVWARSFAGRQGDRREEDSSGASAGAGAFHRGAPVRTCETRVNHARGPVHPWRAAAVEHRSTDPPRAVVEVVDAASRRRVGDRDSTRCVDPSVNGLPRRCRSHGVARDFEAARAMEREVRRIVARHRECATRGGSRPELHRELIRFGGSSPEHDHCDRQDRHGPRGNRCSSPKCRHRPRATYRSTDTCRGCRTCGRSPRTRAACR